LEDDGEDRPPATIREAPIPLASVILIDDLHRAGKVVPNPFGAVADDDFLCARFQPRFQASR
jgi:hypothetical protein